MSEWRHNPDKYWWELGDWDEPRQEFVSAAWVTDEHLARADPRMTAASLYRRLGSLPPPLAEYLPPPVPIMYADAASCARCSGEGWVCESHRLRPWGDMCCDGPRRAAVVHWLHWHLPYAGPFRLAWRIRVLCGHGACHCGGAGDPCPDCNPAADVNWAGIIAEAAP